MPPDHPSDEDLPPHPNEQKSLVGDPESPGTPVKRMDGAPDVYGLNAVR